MTTGLTREADDLHDREAQLTQATEHLEMIEEAAYHLLDAMNEADHAKGLDEKQDARWECTRMREALAKALQPAPEGKEAR